MSLKLVQQANNISQPIRLYYCWSNIFQVLDCAVYRMILHGLSCICLASHNFLYLPIFFSFFSLKMLYMREHYFGLKFTVPSKFEVHTVSHGPSFSPLILWVKHRASRRNFGNKKSFKF